jgi:DNA-binding PadR family transcriptional regulator
MEAIIDRGAKMTWVAGLTSRRRDPIEYGARHAGGEQYIHIAYNHSVNIDDPRPDDLLPLQPAAFHILLSLATDDRHGYAIIQDVAARTGGEVKLSAGTLYRSIQRMLDQDLIVELRRRPAADQDDERRRYYRITEHGREVAEAEARRLAALIRLAKASGFSPRSA